MEENQLRTLIFSVIGGIIGWFIISLIFGSYDIIPLIGVIIGMIAGNLLTKSKSKN